MNKRENSNRKKLDKSSMNIRKIAIIFLIFIVISAVVLHGTYVSALEMKNQMQANLADVARQNAAILDEKISHQYNLLLSLSEELAGVTEENIRSKLDSFKIYLDRFHIKRFAFCFPDGTTYSTDGSEKDLSHRGFYLDGMEGKCSITGVLTDQIDDAHTSINIVTVPVYDEQGNVTGVFGLAYDTEEFNASLHIDSFEGEGYSCILNEYGEIVATSRNSELGLSNNIYDYLREIDSRNEAALDDLKTHIDAQEESEGVIYLSEKNYYYCIPISLMDDSVSWYICTLVPSELIKERVAPLQNNLYQTSILVMFFVVLGAFFLIMIIKRQHQDMLRFAYTDSVTNGTNWAKFCIETNGLDLHDGYLVLMDIANFNNISIVAGTKAMELMIKETWNIIEASIENDELAAHVLDDTYIMYLREADQDLLVGRIEEISDKIHDKASAFHVYGIRARYGIYNISETDTIDDAYTKVKLAKEYALFNSDSNYVFYSEMTRVESQHRSRLETSFPMAIENKEFEVYYQPKYRASDCAVTGSEALVRWRKANGEMVSPGEFIPLFESNGMIVKLDEYMFRSVCEQQRKWIDKGYSVYPVSINISRASLYYLDVAKHYKEILEETGVEPCYVQLEVTESIMDELSDIYDILNDFRKMGIKILMDDFGTGYSSLSTLSSQCFDTLKLDKSLIDNIGNKNGETMLSHIIHMGQEIGLHITAEGVEEKNQLSFLQTLNCDDIQGFYFSKPIPVKEFEELIRN